MRSFIKIVTALFGWLSMTACMFVWNLVFPQPTVMPSPTPQPATAIPTVIPTLGSTATPEPADIPEPITCRDDNCLNACLNRLEDVLETSPFASIENSIYEEQNSDFNLVIYKVNGDQISDPSILYVPPDFHQYQEDTAAHLRIWNFYVAIIPPELREMVHEFVIFTDGAGGGAGAWVTQSIRDPEKWQVGFDLLDSDAPLYLADALIHETGHLLTLNTGQMPYDDLHYYFYDEEKRTFLGCPQYAQDSACSRPDSYVNLFYEKFWKELYPEWSEVDLEAQNAGSFEEYLSLMERFHDDHEDLFLNSYAATHIQEDMAESFSYFVLNLKPVDRSVPAQKINFYYEFPELVEYRRQIIEGLCSYVNE
jgi:hypothetical protein